MHESRRICSLARLLVLFLATVTAGAWTARANAADPNCTASSATLNFPGSISIPPNAPVGVIAGATGTASIIFNCGGLPATTSNTSDYTATIQGGQFLAPRDSTNVTTGPGIRFSTGITGLAMWVQATPVQATSESCLACGPTSTAGYVPGSVVAPKGSSKGGYSGSTSASFTAQLYKTIAGPLSPGTIAATDLIPFWWYISGGSVDSTSISLGASLKLGAIAITVPACTINAPASVALPAVSTRALSPSGTVAGKTAFRIALSGCPTGVTTVTNTFSGSNVDTATGYLKNASASNNVELQLLNGAGATTYANTAIDLKGATATAQKSGVYTLAGQAATLNYYVQYIATGTATAGSVASTVQYTITYP